MRVLLLHPEVSPCDGAWTQERWDLVVDLGFAGRDVYAEWGRTFRARVLSVHAYAIGTESYRWVNQLFDRGRGKLLDRNGLDWWELLAMECYQELHVLYLFNRLRAEITESSIELWATGPHRFVRIAEQVFGRAVRYLSSDRAESSVRRAVRGLRSARNLRPGQIAEIAFDKWDSGYKTRRFWSRPSRARLAAAAILLPSAYSNVTRSALAYAMQLPERKFLLATTRRSAIPDHLPDNVTQVPLAAYAVAASATREETVELKNSWQGFVQAMAMESPEFRHAVDAGLFDYFPAHLERGLLLREAWKQLLGSEPVTGVLCGDDLNYHTRLPLILGRRSGLNALYCSHGALDGGFLFKVPVATHYLVKGQMESDYLLRVASISVEKILVGAPGKAVPTKREPRGDDALVFFSQPYEVIYGHADAIYREILPRLCSVARRSGRKIIVKLHPFESKRARKELITSILDRDDDVEIVEGMPPEEVMSRAWCGVTVDSSVAVECALQQIPFFLCGWLDFTGMGYLQQYARFGVAQVLNSPEEIEQIPTLVTGYRANPAILERLWQQADSAQLDELFFRSRHTRLDPCVC